LFQILADDKLGAALSWIFLGVSTFPGATPRGIRLADYLRTHMQLAEILDGEAAGEREEDEDDFERAISDILTEKEVEEMGELNAKMKKRWIQKKRVTNLATVVKRLKGGPFLRHGIRYSADGHGGPPRDETKTHAPKAGEEVLTPSSSQKSMVGRKSQKESPRKLSAPKKDKTPSVGGETASEEPAPPVPARAAAAPATEGGAPPPKKDKKKKKGK